MVQERERENRASSFGLIYASEANIEDDYILHVIREYYGLQSVDYNMYRSQIGLQGYICQVIS